jgi:hypothetical protein
MGASRNNCATLGRKLIASWRSGGESSTDHIMKLDFKTWVYILRRNIVGIVLFELVHFYQ